jgi:hypothetical protein
MLCTRTGWKVPAPTCSVSQASSAPAFLERGQHRLVEMQAGGRCGDSAGLPGKTVW